MNSCFQILYERLLMRNFLKTLKNRIQKQKHVSPEVDGIMNEPVSQQEVTKVIKLAKSNKAAGCDG